MSVYWVTFRIKRSGNHEERYNDLVAAIRSASSRIWDEPTSFVLFQSNASIDTLADHFGAAVDRVYDIVLIGSPFVQDARIIGIVEDEDLFELMPFTMVG